MAEQAPPSAEYVQCNVRLPSDMAAQLRVIAEAEERSVSGVLRHLIRQRIESERADLEEAA